MRKKRARNRALYIILMLITFCMIMPFFTMIFTSLKGNAEFSSGVRTFLPAEWKFENYVLALQATNWGLYFKNSIIVTFFTVIGSLFFNSLSGYTFARIQFKGRDILFILVLVGLMVPPQVTVIPQFLIMTHMPFFGGNNMFGMGGVWMA